MIKDNISPELVARKQLTDAINDKLQYWNDVDTCEAMTEEEELAVAGHMEKLAQQCMSVLQTKRSMEDKIDKIKDDLSECGWGDYKMTPIEVIGMFVDTLMKKGLDTILLEKDCEYIIQKAHKLIEERKP